MRWSVALLVLCLGAGPGVLQASQARHYDFKVFLDGREIGYHRFSVVPNASRTYVTSEAHFDVKIWFVTVYQYRHTSNEVWESGCLRAIDASTDDNGTQLSVRGQRRDDRLSLQTASGPQRVQGCVRTFAYWDVALLDRPRLLNAQTGEMVPVEVKRLNDAPIEIRGESVLAQRYRIDNEEFRIDLWYSQDRRWLALESTTEGGARLRYLVQ